MALALGLAACGETAPTGDPTAVDGTTASELDTARSGEDGIGYDKVAREVVAALTADGEAPVLVSLTDPAGDGLGDRSDGSARDEIARMQDRVLDELDAGDFRARIAYEAIPALAGVVLTPRGLAILDDHPDVVAVALDPGGTGGSGG